MVTNVNYKSQLNKVSHLNRHKLKVTFYLLKLTCTGERPWGGGGGGGTNTRDNEDYSPDQYLGIGVIGEPLMVSNPDPV